MIVKAGRLATTAMAPKAYSYVGQYDCTVSLRCRLSGLSAGHGFKYIDLAELGPFSHCAYSKRLQDFRMYNSRYYG